MVKNQNFHICIIGNSSAIPAGGFHLSGQLVNIHQSFFLIDCGEGTQIELLGKKTKYQKIDYILISHLHGDHFFGLPGLLSTYNLLNRTRDLHIYCPENIENYINNTFEIAHTTLKYKVHYHKLDSEKKTQIIDNERFSLYSFPLEHRIPTCGFLFVEKPKAPNINKNFIEKYKPSIAEIKRIKQGYDFHKDGLVFKNSEITTEPNEPLSYAYCSDTRINEKIPEFIKNVTLLYHEATFDNSMQNLADEKFHSTAADAAKTAKLANASKLLLGHFSARLDDMKELKDEASAIFSNTEISKEGYHYSPE